MIKAIHAIPSIDHHILAEGVKAMPMCEFCRRNVGELSTHHLVSRTRHKKHKKNFTRDDFKGRPVNLCRLCHKQVHKLTSKEAKQYF